ncbi:MAG: response regulator transcription factor [Acidobacteria bacterium]|nr:response regulator transcription factor [Acidobacteriota bacterium]
MNNEAQIRVLSVDDHPLLSGGISLLINSQLDMISVGHASTGQESLQLYRELRPDIVLMDLRLPDISGIDATIAIRNEFPEARIIMLTTADGDMEVRRALDAGARSYLLKSMPGKEMVDVIRQVHAGKKKIPAEIAAQLAEHYNDETLSAREIEVLQQIAGGNRNKDIAERLFISEDTVKAHIKHLMEKLGANDRTEAVAIGVRRGIIHL